MILSFVAFECSIRVATYKTIQIKNHPKNIDSGRDKLLGRSFLILDVMFSNSLAFDSELIQFRAIGSDYSNELETIKMAIG